MATEFNTLIVGAGPAGCAAAFDLASAGKRVLLLDKRTFPRPKACACGLTRKTLKALRYSVDPVIERVCHEILLQPSGVPREAAADTCREVRVKARTPLCAMAVREHFDEFCLNQTLASGREGGHVELIKIDSVVALHERNSHVELEIATAQGPRTFTAPAVIGADGSNGQIQRLAALQLHADRSNRAAPSPDQAFALEAAVPYAELPSTLPSGNAPHDLIFDFAPLPGGYGWLFPKGDHINIGIFGFAPSADAPEKLRLITRTRLIDYAQRKLGVKELGAITGQQLGVGGHTYVPRGRVLLAGDAAGLVDPLTGEGIHSAIVSGQAAAAAVLSATTNTPEGLAKAYAHQLRPLQHTLAFSHRAALAFYAEPNRGFKAMRLPLMRRLILKTYTDGMPGTKLITLLAKLA